MLNILVELQLSSKKQKVSSKDRLQVQFYSGTVLATGSISDFEIKFLETLLDFARIERQINDHELTMYFRNESFQNFTETSAFKRKSNWGPPMGHPNLKFFSIHLEKDLVKK